MTLCTFVIMCSCQLSAVLSRKLKVNTVPAISSAIYRKSLHSIALTTYQAVTTTSNNRSDISTNDINNNFRKLLIKETSFPQDSINQQQRRHYRVSKIVNNTNAASEGGRGQKLKGNYEAPLERDDSDEALESKEYPSPLDEEYVEYTAGQSGFENENMVKLTPLQRAIITVGSGLSAFLDPTKAENIATFGEISAGPVLRRLYQRMLEDPEGHRILTQKPRINSRTVDLDYLSKLPEGTLGWAYIQFLRKNNVTPDSRLPVRFIEDPELAYVMQRYREVHDLVHTVTGQPTNMLGEVVVKWIEGIQTGLPMCVTGGLFGATRLRPKQRQRYLNTHLKWAIDVGFTSKPFLFVFYEERWEQRLDDLQFYICPKLLTPPPEKNAKT